jgi:hypothetical protein
VTSACPPSNKYLLSPKDPLGLKALLQRLVGPCPLFVLLSFCLFVFVSLCLGSPLPHTTERKLYPVSLSVEVILPLRSSLRRAVPPQCSFLSPCPCQAPRHISTCQLAPLPFIIAFPSFLFSLFSPFPLLSHHLIFLPPTHANYYTVLHNVLRQRQRESSSHTRS